MGGLLAGTGTVGVHRTTATGVEDAERDSKRDERRRIQATIVRTSEKASPTQSAAITRLASVSLPSRSVSSHRSNASTSGAPMQTIRMSVPTSRQALTLF